MNHRHLFAGVSLFAVLGAAGSVFAADTPTAVTEVIVTGTRVTGVKAEDSAAPVQVRAL